MLFPFSRWNLKIKINEGRHDFDIFRKRTATETTDTRGDSFHHPTQEMAAYSSVIHRLTSLPLRKDRFEREVQTIQYLADENNINVNVRSAVRKNLHTR